MSISTSNRAFARAVPGTVRGTVPGTVRGTVPGMVRGTVPGMVRGTDHRAALMNTTLRPSGDSAG